MRKHTAPRDIVVVQQYYYPDFSAVAQLLSQLVDHLAASSPTRTVFVYTSARVRAKLFPGQTLQTAANVIVQRSRLLVPLRFRGIGQGVEMAFFHLWAFVKILFGPRRHIVSFTTPPLIGFTVGLACRLRGLPLYPYVEDLYPELLFDTRLLRPSSIVKKTAILNRLTFAMAQRIVVIGRDMQRKIMNNYGVPEDRFSIVRNWSSATIPTSFTIPSYRFLYSGNFGHGHDFELMKSFFGELQKRVPVTLQLVGGGKRYRHVIREMRNTVERLDVSGYVTTEQHIQHLSDASFLIAVQDYRTVGDLVPSKFYTYAAAGRPILFFGPRITEIGRTILSEQIGSVIEVPEDIPPAIDYVINVVQNEERYRSTCHRSRSYSVQTGGAERAARQLLQVVETE